MIGDYLYPKDGQIIGIEYFLQSVGSWDFENATNKLLADLEQEIASLKVENIHALMQKNYMVQMKLYFAEKELQALAEMRILYLYKHFEIYLKLLLIQVFRDADERNLYKWEETKKFLKRKGVRIGDIDNHNEIDELKKVSDAIKHSYSIIGEKTKTIKEFKGKNLLSSQDLINFYNRVKHSVLGFIISLIGKIQIEE
ncbi:hypothetical protein [Flagellimonas baculiformis]|uniref:hypothetical protein n=1 Tax=Flagellimonas baculiformis TaxID=3067310 RepID=UPI00296FD883|nr:hypothetical protein [Muricauda sp. D6]